MYAREASTLHTNQRRGTNTRDRDFNRAFGAKASKKRGDWLLPVPLTEALRLPYSQERATLRPHADMYNTPLQW